MVMGASVSTCKPVLVQMLCYLHRRGGFYFSCSFLNTLLIVISMQRVRQGTEECRYMRPCAVRIVSEKLGWRGQAWLLIPC